MGNYDSHAQPVVTYKSADWSNEGTPLLIVGGAMLGIVGFVTASMINVDLFTFVNGAVAIIGGMAAPHALGTFSRRAGISKSLQEKTAKVNAAIFDLTGDASQQLTTQQVYEIMEKESVESVPVNGVPGIEVYSRSEKGSHNAYDREIVIQSKATDNGIESFDHLVKAAARKHSGIQSVSGLYRGDAS